MFIVVVYLLLTSPLLTADYKNTSVISSKPIIYELFLTLICFVIYQALGIPSILL